MASKNKGKVIQMLSPENYIRKKARSLPIYECWINADWENSGMANIVIARRHTNGNITFCLYLVDLLCLGVKDTFFKFNITETEYRNFLEKLEEEMGMEITGYALVHNIILSGVEFAEEYGFKPYKDFTSVTEFMLEEDNDDIELIEIECGRDGKPLYIQGPFEDAVKSNKIMKQLEHLAGVGNYDFIKEVDLVDPGFDDTMEDEDEFEDITFEERGSEFLKSYKHIEKLNDYESERFFKLLQSLVDDFIDVEEHNRYYDQLLEELTSVKINKTKIPNEMLGIESGNEQISDEIKQSFLSVITDEASIKQRKKQLETFSKNKGIDAAVTYLDVLISGLDRSFRYPGKLKEAAKKYTNYALVQLKWTKFNITQNKKLESVPHYPCRMEDYFRNRKSIHEWEYFCYLDTYVHFVLAERNFDKLEALNSVLVELDIEEKAFATFRALINIFQTEIVAKHLKEEKIK